MSEDSGSTKGAIHCEDSETIQVAFPPLPEQEALSKHIQTETRTLDHAITRLRARNRAYSASTARRLVADVVTGKLDVREAAAQLPEEAAPDTAEDDTDLSIDPEAADEEAVV